jgi:uncharacterized circularly permuted ATP-grasp superfamily protein
VNFHNYDPEGFYDELFAGPGSPRPGAALFVQRIDGLTDGELRRRQEAAELALLNMGITFNVYGEESGTERIFPFDIIPRIVQASEWTDVEAGLRQRILALNRFVDDVYHERRIVSDGIIPEFVIESAAGRAPSAPVSTLPAGSGAM